MAYSATRSNDDVFNLSITELLLIIMFSLLIVMVILNSSLKDAESEKSADLEALKESWKTLDEINAALGLSIKDGVKEDVRHSISDSPSTDDTEQQNDSFVDAPSEMSSENEPKAPIDMSIALAQMQALVKELNKSVTSEDAEEVLARMRINEVWTSLSRDKDGHSGLDKLIEELRKITEELETEKNSNEELANEVSNLQDMLDNFTESGDEKEQLLAKLVVEANEDKAEMEKLVNQVKNLSNNGKVLPPCWVSDNGKSEYTYNIEIKDNSLLIIPTYPEYRENDFLNLADVNVSNEEIDYAKFRNSMDNFYTYGVESDPECRFYVRVYDRASESAKDEYKNGLKTVELIFYKFQPEDWK